MNAENQPHRGLSSQQQLEPPATPPANEDLTIAEHLREWKQSATDAEDTYRDEAGQLLHIPESAARKFVTEYGPLHPGDYLAKHRRDWREDFALLRETP
jgi:hypothetical protein